MIAPCAFAAATASRQKGLARRAPMRYLTSHDQNAAPPTTRLHPLIQRH
ncbi:MAG: hypothetical protein AAFY49_06005 [Pseudomonadota bacterium]